MQKKIIVGISGASGTVYGLKALSLLQQAGAETHLVISKTAILTAQIETGLKLADVQAMAHHCWRADDLAAPIASGSFSIHGMIVAPCSIRTLGEIVTGITSSLLSRAADVTLKERRPLVLMVRETPLHLGHLRSMVAAAEMGAIVAPPLPAFYNHPETVDDLVTYSVGRSLELLGISVAGLGRWMGRPSQQDRTTLPPTAMPGCHSQPE